MNLIGRRRIWYALSLLVIVPGVVSLIFNHLQLGIDFAGGSVETVGGHPDPAILRNLAAAQGFKDVTVTTAGDNAALRYRDPAPTAQQDARHTQFKATLAKQGINEQGYSTVGPVVQQDIIRKAFISVVLAAFAIVLYIAFAFRNAPPPVSPWSFGFAAIAALLHDVLLVIGIFSILGKLAGVEIDSLFVTAVLTVMGFSVHDTIVVFDRIRENLRRERKPFEEVVNDSVNETLARSINTSLTVLLTLLALFLFGGDSIRMFVLALLIGIASGTYSSIFNASPLLVTWHLHKLKRIGRK